jgi:hypothetical protein
MAVSEARAEHEALARRDEEFAAWVEAITTYRGEIDAEHAQRFIETFRRLAIRLNSEPPPALPEASLSLIRRLIIEALERAVATERPVDLLDSLLVRAEGIRHVIRDVLDGDVPVNPDDAAAIVRQIEEWLPSISQREIAVILGTSPRSIQRWASTRISPSRRALLAARLIALLRHGWSPEGVVAWFMRPRRELDHHAPIELLDDAAREHDLLELARAGRAQHAG